MNLHAAKGKVSFASAFLSLILFATPINALFGFISPEVKIAAKKSGLFLTSGITFCAASGFGGQGFWYAHETLFGPFIEDRKIMAIKSIACLAAAGACGYTSYRSAKNFYTDKKNKTSQKITELMIGSGIAVLSTSFFTLLIY